MEARDIEVIRQEYRNECFAFGEKLYLLGAYAVDSVKIFKKLTDLNMEGAEVQKKAAEIAMETAKAQEKLESEASNGKEDQLICS